MRLGQRVRHDGGRVGPGADGVQTGRHRVPDPFGGADDPFVRLAGECRGQQASHVVRVNVFAFLDVLCRDPDRIAIALDLAAARNGPDCDLVAEGNSAPRLYEPQRFARRARYDGGSSLHRELVQDGGNVVRRIE